MEPTVRQLRIVNSVICGIALLVTTIRLWMRYQRRKLWWDDFWVVMAGLCIIILMAANFYHTADPNSIPRHVKIAIYYLCVQFYYAVTWTSRLSILFTIIRISSERLRRLLVIFAWLFGLSWTILTAQVFWVCEPEPEWKERPTPQCILGKDVVIAQVITFIASDAILVFAPVKLIWAAQLARVTRIRLIAIFTATLITTAVSLYYIYAVLRVGGFTEELAATIHDGVSLLVANLSVVMSFAVRSESALTTDEVQGNGFRPSRRTPARSFGWLSSGFSTYGKVSTPTHVQIRIEQVDDKSFVDNPYVPQEKGPVDHGRYVGADVVELNTVDPPKTQGL